MNLEIPHNNPTLEKFWSQMELLWKEYNKGKLCTANELNTICEPTNQTTCVDGKDQVYFLDSCGNYANIYDSTKINDEGYWEDVVTISESCGVDDEFGNSDSTTCGNCNRIVVFIPWFLSQESYGMILLQSFETGIGAV